MASRPDIDVMAEKLRGAKGKPSREKAKPDGKPVRQRKGILQRKTDCVYLGFFVIHIIVMLILDLPPLYPARLRPQFVHVLHEWYVGKYGDLFFGANAPAWFRVYVWMEAGGHFPISCWAVWGLIGDHPYVPLYLFPFALQTSITTLTCIAEMLSWPVPRAQKTELAWLYVPYFCFGLIMSLDMFLRLKRRVR